MSRAVFLPVTQVRLTNVAVVRLSRGGKRFEVACYKNKILNWRNGLETDLSGVLANKKDVAKAFGTQDQDEVIRFILEKGIVQVSEKERKAQQEETFRDVATIISDKCVNPDSNRPYTVGVIESALKGLHVSLHPIKAPKAQALELIPRLAEVMPLARAAMKLRVMCAPEYLDEVRGVLESFSTQSIKTDSSGELNVVADPGVYRSLEKQVASVTRGTGRVEVFQMNVHEEGSADIGAETARRDRERKSRDAEATVQSSANEVRTVARGEEGIVTTTDTGGEKVYQRQEEEVVESSKDLTTNRTTAKVTGNRKGKKARRREIEAAAVRQSRIDTERKRREERAAKVIAAAGNLIHSKENNDDANSTNKNLTCTNSNNAVTKLKCNTCKETFENKIYHQEHFKSDYHRENLRQKIRGEPPLTITEWEAGEASGSFLMEDHADLL